MAKTKLSLTTDEVKMWLARIDRSREWRRPHIEKWKRFIRYAECKFDNMSGEISVNLVHPHVRIIIPAIYSKNPDVVVVPRQKSAVEAARVMEVLLRYLIKEIGLKEEAKFCILDAILIGHSWIKVGYQTDFAQVTGNKVPLVQKVFDALSKAMSGEEEEVEESTYYLQPDERIVSEMAWALRVSPFDMFVPAFSSGRHDLPWIVHQYLRRMSDVKKNPLYENTKNLTPSSKAVDLIKEKAAGTNKVVPIEDDEEEYSLLYEIWDCTKNLIYIIPDEHDHAIEVKPNEYTFLDSRHTFEMLGFNFIPDRFYPLSEIEPWEPQLMELKQLRTQQSTHRKRFNRKYVYSEGDFTPSALETLKAGEDGALVPSQADDVRASIQPVMDAALPSDVYQAERWIKEDITNIGGITDYQRGTSQSGAKTATEASIVETQSRFRSEERLDIVGTFIERIIRNLGMICQHFMDQEQVFPIIGDDAIRWQKVDKRAIQGEMLFNVVYGSTAAINRDVEKQQLLQAYELIAQDPIYDPIKIRTEFLRKVLGVTNPAEWMRPDIAAMLKEAEMQAIQDAMVGGAGGGGVGGGNGVSPGIGQSGDMLGAIRRALAVRTPGGVGGGKMTE